MNMYAEQVLIRHLLRHREFDRSRPYSREHPGGHVKSEKALAELRASIAAEGILEPLIIHYDPRTRQALIGEGNHRIWLAAEAGLLAVPAVGTYSSPGYLFGRASSRHDVQGEPRLRPKVPDGYFPSMFRLSLVLPEFYFPEPPVPFIPGIDFEPCLVSQVAS